MVQKSLLHFSVIFGIDTTILLYHVAYKVFTLAGTVPTKRYYIPGTQIFYYTCFDFAFVELCPYYDHGASENKERQCV